MDAPGNRRWHRRLGAGGVLALLLLAGCSSPDDPSVGQEPPPIIEGTEPEQEQSGDSGSPGGPPSEPLATTPAPTDGVIPSSASAFEELARRELEEGRIAYDPPGQMRVGEPQRIEARITRQELGELTEGLEGDGDALVETLLVGTRVRAELRGRNFDIVGLGEEVQQLRLGGFREWSWDVEAVRQGRQELQLVVSVIHGEDPVPIETRTFARTIEVRVDPGRSMLSFVGRHWPTLLASSGVTVAGAAAYLRRLLRSRQRPQAAGASG